MQNFSTGAIDRMGFGYDTLKQLKPDIIMISICGYGQTGPERKYMGYGPASVPLAGISSLTGYPGVGTGGDWYFGMAIRTPASLARLPPWLRWPIATAPVRGCTLTWLSGKLYSS